MYRAAIRGDVLAGIALLVAGLSVAGAQMPRDPRPPLPRPMPEFGTYVGQSASGNFQEALDDAVSKATTAGPSGIWALRYRVSQIGGTAGGAGGNTLTVTIQLAPQDRPHMAE